MTSDRPATGRPPEAPRDQLESAFTPILREVWDCMPCVLAAVFVDFEGECIDYVSSLDPYEAKVNAAHMLVLMDALDAARPKLRSGPVVLLEISGVNRELWGRRVSDEYLLVVVLAPGFDRSQMRSIVGTAGARFREEVGLGTPPWEPSRAALSVTVRAAVGWPYAPTAFSEDGINVGITDVLGRWTEPGGIGGDELVCFRVRTEDGQELTLVHDPDGEGWTARL